jgi:hypothetical protein
MQKLYLAMKTFLNLALKPIRESLGEYFDRLCGLVVRVLGYRSGGPGSIPGTTRFSGKKKTVVSTTEELLDRKVAAPV